LFLELPSENRKAAAGKPVAFFPFGLIWKYQNPLPTVKNEIRQGIIL
jgi:hypothetical protein